MKRILVTNMKEIHHDDLVLGTDGSWHSQIPLEIYIPESMYRIYFDNNGHVECSGDHHWILLDPDHRQHDLTTDEIYEMWTDNVLLVHLSCIGEISGPTIIDMKKIDPKPVRCLSVDSNDHQFQIVLKESK